MVALSLQAPPIPQKTGRNYGNPGNDDENQEKTHEPAKDFNRIRNDFHGYLRDVILHIQQWLGVTR